MEICAYYVESEDPVYFPINSGDYTWPTSIF